jgi:predicted AAA+ superfamily ATPase
MQKIELNIDEMLDGFTRDGMKKFVKRLLSTSEAEEKRLLSQLNKSKKNELADLDEEMHGKPNTPMVTDDDLQYDGDDELPDVPKKKGKK